MKLTKKILTYNSDDEQQMFDDIEKKIKEEGADGWFCMSRGMVVKVNDVYEVEMEFEKQ